MNLYYAISLVAVVGSLSIVLLIKQTNVKSVTAVVGFAVVTAVVIQVDPIAITKARIGPMELEQNLERARSIRTEIEHLKLDIDSAAYSVAENAQRVVKAERDLSEIVRLFVELNVLETELSPKIYSSGAPRRYDAIVDRRSKLMDFLGMSNHERMALMFKMSGDMGHLEKFGLDSGAVDSLEKLIRSGRAPRVIRAKTTSNLD